MKLRAPDGCWSFSLEGQPVDIGPDLSAEVPDRFREHCLAHGFRPWNDGSPEVSIEAMTHAQLVLEVLRRTKEALEHFSTEELRRQLLATTPQTVILPDESDAAGVKIDAEHVTVEDVEKMGRPELFAFLKVKGIAVSLPVKNDELREYARMALEPVSSKEA